MKAFILLMFCLAKIAQASVSSCAQYTIDFSIEKVALLKCE